MKHDVKFNRVGVYPGFSNEEYHTGPGVSKSSLDVVDKSPAHFKQSRLAGYKKSTPAQKRGTMFHTIVLEPETFWDCYAKPFEEPAGALKTADDIKSRLKELGLPTNGTKPVLTDRLREADPDVIFLDEAKAAYADAVGKKEIITEEELATVEAMRDAVMAHPRAGKLFAPKSGVAELSCYWKDQETGVLCRCRPDWWRFDGKIVDLKSAADASPEGFEASMAKWSYYKQDPFYLDGASEAVKQGPDHGMPAPTAFIFVACEPEAPHAVGVYVLGQEEREIGRRHYRKSLETYAECEAKDEWPAYSDRIEPIGLPGWFLRKEAYENEGE
ncbi:PD-(D/E)XK nuclease-like domain-containing protein [Sulfitobacter sp. 1A13679]|uniref:PD-(D/E)XK nuclease-like domain-containing protein n=1 Tax=Sulfitobacter sp. 1A13679 TaxID=3368597 RepID=UPI003744C87F